MGVKPLAHARDGSNASLKAPGKHLETKDPATAARMRHGIQSAQGGGRRTGNRAALGRSRVPSRVARPLRGMSEGRSGAPVASPCRTHALSLLARIHARSGRISTAHFPCPKKLGNATGPRQRVAAPLPCHSSHPVTEWRGGVRGAGRFSAPAVQRGPSAHDPVRRDILPRARWRARADGSGPARIPKARPARSPMRPGKWFRWYSRHCSYRPPYGCSGASGLP